jgi:hypothetical protein
MSDVKGELKAWERQFHEKWGRKPTVEDIKKDPVIGTSSSRFSSSTLQRVDRHIDKYS